MIVVSRLYIATVSNPAARLNFARTVLADHGPYFWGLRPGPRNLRRWQNLSTGDAILFKENDRYRALGIVVETSRNKVLATELWGTNAAHETWELLILLDSPVRLDVRAKEYAIYFGQRHAGLVPVNEKSLVRAQRQFGLVTFQQTFGLR